MNGDLKLFHDTVKFADRLNMNIVIEDYHQGEGRIGLYDQEKKLGTFDSPENLKFYLKGWSDAKKLKKKGGTSFPPFPPGIRDNLTGEKNDTTT